MRFFCWENFALLRIFVTIQHCVGFFDNALNVAVACIVKSVANCDAGHCVVVFAQFVYCLQKLLIQFFHFCNAVFFQNCAKFIAADTIAKAVLAVDVSQLQRNALQTCVAFGMTVGVVYVFEFVNVKNDYYGVSADIRNVDVVTFSVEQTGHGVYLQHNFVVSSVEQFVSYCNTKIVYANFGPNELYAYAHHQNHQSQRQNCVKTNLIFFSVAYDTRKTVDNGQHECRHVDKIEFFAVIYVLRIDGEHQSEK